MRYPNQTGYQDRRRARRTEIKAALLLILQRLEQADERPDMAALAIRFGCGVTTLRNMRRELGQEGLIQPPEEKRLARIKASGEVPDLAERIAAVREAKFAKWARTRKRCLNETELEEVLP